MVALWCVLIVTTAPTAAQDLLSYYSFDATPTNGAFAEYQTGEWITDDSGNGHDVKVTGPGLTWTFEGQLNGAIRFDGNTAFLEDTDADAYLNDLEAFTIMVWIRSDIVGTDAGIVTSDSPDDDDQNISLRYDEDGLFGDGVNVVKGGVRTVNGKQEYESRSFAQASTWQHLALVYESGEPLQLVINGTVDDATYQPLRTDGPISDVEFLRIGQGAKMESDVWDGLIDELRIYDGALSPPRIREIMEQPLPVELAAFRGSADGSTAVLEWETLTETNNDGFEIEHRRPGASAFESAGFRKGQGTTNTPTRYAFERSGLEPGTHAFRLRQIDVDGAETVIDPVTVSIAPDEPMVVSTYPNPVQAQGTVSVQVRDASDVRVDLYNVLGQRVKTIHRGTVRPGAAKRMPLQTGNLPSGTYFVRATGPSGTTTQRISVVK